VIYAERLDLNHDMAGLWFGVREFLDHQILGVAELWMTIARIEKSSG
jgi:hypothetical protein